LTSSGEGGNYLATFLISISESISADTGSLFAGLAELHAPSRLHSLLQHFVSITWLNNGLPMRVNGFRIFTRIRPKLTEFHKG
jgi:hypothetical protein